MRPAAEGMCKAKTTVAAMGGVADEKKKEGQFVSVCRRLKRDLAYN